MNRTVLLCWMALLGALTALAGMRLEDTRALASGSRLNSTGREARPESSTAPQNRSGFVGLFGGEGEESLRAVAPLEDGGFVLAGERHYYDKEEWLSAWLVRIDASGRMVWQKAVGGGGHVDYVEDLVRLSEGGLVVAGGTRALGWVARLDEEGQLLWERVLGGPEEEYHVLQVAEGNAGSLWVLAGYAGRGASGRLVARIDSYGRLLWIRRLHSANPRISYEACRLAAAAGGGVILTGHLAGHGPWVARLDRDGQIQWQKVLRWGQNPGTSVVTALQGGCYVLAGAEVLRFGPDGDLRWHRQFDVPFDSCRLLRDDRDGALVLGTGCGDAMSLARLSGAGELSWARSYRARPGGHRLGATTACASPSGGILVGGTVEERPKTTQPRDLRVGPLEFGRNDTDLLVFRTGPQGELSGWSEPISLPLKDCTVPLGDGSARIVPATDITWIPFASYWRDTSAPSQTLRICEESGEPWTPARFEHFAIQKKTLHPAEPEVPLSETAMAAAWGSILPEVHLEPTDLSKLEDVPAIVGHERRLEKLGYRALGDFFPRSVESTEGITITGGVRLMLHKDGLILAEINCLQTDKMPPGASRVWVNLESNFGRSKEGTHILLVTSNVSFRSQKLTTRNTRIQYYEHTTPRASVAALHSLHSALMNRLRAERRCNPLVISLESYREWQNLAHTGDLEALREEPFQELVERFAAPWTVRTEVEESWPPPGIAVIPEGRPEGGDWRPSGNPTLQSPDG